MISKWNELVIQERENQPMAKTHITRIEQHSDDTQTIYVDKIANSAARDAAYYNAARNKAKPVSGFVLSENDLDLISELLPMATSEMQSLLTATHKRFPEAALCESLRSWIEHAADIRVRIEAR